MILYAVAGALAVGISLGLFGSGGSILTVPILVYLLHHPEKVAIGESLGIVGVIAMVGSLPYAFERLVNWRLAFLFGVPGMLGTAFGAFISGSVPGSVQLLVFSLVMGGAAFAMWRRTRALRVGAVENAQVSDDTNDEGPPSALLTLFYGAAVGVMTGFVGVGGGFLIVPALVLLGRLQMRHAVATSLVIITMNAGVGFARYSHDYEMIGATPAWGTMLLFMIVGTLGSFAGRSLQGRLNQRLLQRGFAVFLVVMSVFVLVKETGDLLDRGATPPHSAIEGHS